MKHTKTRVLAAQALALALAATGIVPMPEALGVISPGASESPATAPCAPPK